MIRILFLMLVLLAGLIGGPYLAGKQGYVLIQTEHHNIELSITSLVIIFVLALAIIYSIEWCLRRFFSLSNSTYGWFSRRKRVRAQKQTLEGFINLSEGNYSRAEKLIGKNAKHSDEPILNFITAAEAAQQRGDEFNANRYLIEATELAGSDNLIVELARTRILLAQGKLPAARSSVDSLLEMTQRNNEVLKLAVEIYLKSKAYLALDSILYQIETSGLYDHTAFSQLERQVEDGLLDEKMNEEGADGLLAWWDAQSRKRHNDAYVRVGLIQRLIDCNDHENAYELVLESLKKWDEKNVNNSALFAQITRLQAADSSKLIKLLEKRAKKVEENQQCCLNRALGYLYVRDNNFAKASDAFKIVIADKSHLQPHDIAMAAYVFEQVGEQGLAQQIREEQIKATMAVDEIKSDTANSNEQTTALLENKSA